MLVTLANLPWNSLLSKCQPNNHLTLAEATIQCMCSWLSCCPSRAHLSTRCLPYCTSIIFNMAIPVSRNWDRMAYNIVTSTYHSSMLHFPSIIFSFLYTLDATVPFIFILHSHFTDPKLINVCQCGEEQYLWAPNLPLLHYCLVLLDVLCTLRQKACYGPLLTCHFYMARNG